MTEEKTDEEAEDEAPQEDCREGFEQGQSSDVAMPADIQERSAGALNRICLLVAAAAGTMLAGCGGGAGSDPDRVLRVSAPYGLSSLRDLNQDAAGTNANIIELLLDPVAEHAEIVRRDGTRVSLLPLPSEPLTVHELAASLRAPGLRSVQVSAAGEIIAEFTDPQRAEMFARPRGQGFALGPYELEDENIEGGWIRLRSRGDTAMDVIEITAVDDGEQWRRLHARAIDVVPMSPAPTRGAYAGMRSVRLIDYPVVYAVALFLNTRDSALTDPAVRRSLARIIDRSAVAAVACGMADCVIARDPPEGSGAELPRMLRVGTLASYSVGLDAARVIRLQLHRAGVDSALERQEIGELTDRLRDGDYQILILPFPLGMPGLRSMRGDSIANLTGWSRADFDAAVDAGDQDAAMRLLRDEVPVLLLFEDRDFAAVDARYCGGHPAHYSWRWLADLHPCEEGNTR